MKEYMESHFRYEKRLEQSVRGNVFKYARTDSEYKGIFHVSAADILGRRGRLPDIFDAPHRRVPSGGCCYVLFRDLSQGNLYQAGKARRPRGLSHTNNFQRDRMYRPAIHGSDQRGFRCRERSQCRRYSWSCRGPLSPCRKAKNSPPL